MFNALEIKVPPLALVFLVSALPWRSAIGLTFGTVGLGIVLASVSTFRRAKTTVNPLTPEATTTMVTSGIYRFTRNPMSPK
jgi:protein-S-isoprenylcysteine O-methyltransferase Ste14